MTSGFGQTQLVEGRARVIDGDTIKIGKSRIRLHGIDAPESKQRCKDKKLNYKKYNRIYLDSSMIFC